MGKVAYWVELHDELSQVHNTFYVSKLQKFVVDDNVFVPLDDVQVDDHLNYVERSVVIMD